MNVVKIYYNLPKHKRISQVLMSERMGIKPSYMTKLISGEKGMTQEKAFIFYLNARDALPKDCQRYIYKTVSSWLIINKSDGVEYSSALKEWK